MGAFMAKHHLLETKIVTFGEMIGNGKIYRIPLYQRDYSWEKEQWEELWDDIIQIMQQPHVHYMGAIMLQNRDGGVYTVIDGQQRIATLSILTIAVIQCLIDLIKHGHDEENNIERKEILIRKFLGDKDPTSLKYSSKLFLNVNNNAFYQSYLLQFKPPINPKRLNDSEKLLWNAYEYFYDALQKTPEISKNGETLSTFLNDIIAEQFTFIQITVEDELSAYTVFETLNARGVRLTPTDLLKNYLFSLVSETDIDHVQTQWKRIIDIVGLTDFPVFLRHYLNSRQKLVRHDRLFKEIKAAVKTNESVFALLDCLERSAAIYAALDNPDDSLWDEMPEHRKYLRQLSLFKVTQAKPILLTGYEKLASVEFAKLLHIVLVIAFRYNVIAGLNPKVFEDTYNKAAMKIFSGEVTTAKAIFQELQAVYLSDEEFKNMFSTKTLKTRQQGKLARYILFAIENQIGNKNYDFEESSATIEHILPENPAERWNESFKPEEQEAFVYRLGNYSLLESKLNKRYAANASFDEKKEVYAQSQYQLSQQITQAEWTPNTLKKRQQQMANYAAAIWKISY